MYYSCPPVCILPFKFASILNRNVSPSRNLTRLSSGDPDLPNYFPYAPEFIIISLAARVCWVRLWDCPRDSTVLRNNAGVPRDNPIYIHARTLKISATQGIQWQNEVFLAPWQEVMSGVDVSRGWYFQHL